MAAELIICNAYYYWLDPKQEKNGQPYPPLGTLYAAAYLRDNGFNLHFHDNNLKDNREELYASIRDIKPKYLVLFDDGFNYLTKMCLTKMREVSIEIAKYAKEHGATVIFNSSDSTDHYEHYHEEGIDFIIHGEGELSLLELLNVLKHDQPYKEVLGISYMDNEVLNKNPSRPVLRNLDDLPMAAWDLADIQAYKKIWENNHGYFSLNLATTRGCPYKCNWCAKPIYGNRYNSRSPERVVMEIAHLIDEYDCRYFWMCDDIFGLKPNWVKQFNKLVQEKNLDFKYKIQSRVDLMLKEDQITDLVQSGADVVWVGAESGSQKILDAMDKGTDVSQIYEATRKLKEQNIRVAFFLQFGYIDEKWEDIQMTLRMVLDLMPDDIGISVSYPLPGTKFYEKVKNSMKLKTNWTDSDDLDMMFQNTYSPLFYKTLHRYVHNRYRIKKAWIGFLSMLKFKSIINNFIHVARGVYHLPMAFINSFLLKLRARS